MKALILKLLGRGCSPSEYETRLDDAERASGEGRFGYALAHAKRIAHLNPSNPGAWRVMAQALWGLGKTGKAREIVKKALEAAPNDVESLCLAGSIEIDWTEDLGSYHFLAAKEYFQKVAEVDPHNARALVGLGNCEAGMATHSDEARAKAYLLRAIEYYDRALATEPTDLNILCGILFSKALSLYDLGGHDDAVRLLHGILAKNPDFAPARQCLDDISQRTK